MERKLCRCCGQVPKSMVLTEFDKVLFEVYCPQCLRMVSERMSRERILTFFDYRTMMSSAEDKWNESQEESEDGV